MGNTVVNIKSIADVTLRVAAAGGGRVWDNTFDFTFGPLLSERTNEVRVTVKNFMGAIVIVPTPEPVEVVGLDYDLNFDL